MESWSYVSGRKGPVSNETISSSNTFARSKNTMGGCDLKSLDNNILVSGQQAIENQVLEELGYQEMIGKQSPDSSIRNSLNSKFDSEKAIDPFAANPNSFSLEDESTSRHLCSVVDSSNRGSSFFDLKLGRFGDPKNAQTSRISEGTPNFSSSDSSMPPKRARMGVNSHVAYCQVYGCNKDLSSSKEYHKRHKVCEVHSKTAKVIVNGIEQRFCQQCSRFHLLAEFDDGKRSCRKRLAGHNERRRKPRASIQSGRTGRIVQSYNDGIIFGQPFAVLPRSTGFSGVRLHGTPVTTSFICQDILPSHLFHPETYGTNDWCRGIKIEDRHDISPLSAIPISRSIFTGYPLNLGGPNSGSHSFFHDFSMGNEDFTAFDAASTIRGFSEITDSGCALSLLSSQSQNSSSHPIAHPLVVPGSNSHCSMSHISDKLIGAYSHASTSAMSNTFSSLVMNCSEATHFDPTMVSDSDASNFGIIAASANGMSKTIHSGKPRK